MKAVSKAISFSVARIVCDPTRGAGDWYRLVLHYTGDRRNHHFSLYDDPASVRAYVARFHPGLPEVP